jgi:hypothetical protein
MNSMAFKYPLAIACFKENADISITIMKGWAEF